MRRNTLDYEYQKKMALQQQNQVFLVDLLKTSEKEKRDSIKSTLITSYSLLSQGMSSFLQSPKSIFQIAYLSTMIFGAYQLTRIAAAFAMARFGRPSLVRETSKIGINQLFSLPFHMAKRAVHRSVKKR